MAYVPVPKDLSKVKTKVAFNLTKRQIVCFAAALLFGLPLFFLLKDSTGTSLASMAMIAVMLPCFLFAMYEKHGQPLEVVVKNIIQTKFIAPKERPYWDTLCHDCSRDVIFTQSFEQFFLCVQPYPTRIDQNIFSGVQLCADQFQHLLVLFLQASRVDSIFRCIDHLGRHPLF